MQRADEAVASYCLRPKLALTAILALAGCGTSPRQCPNPDAGLSTRDAGLVLPDGCRAVRTSADGVVTLACDGGRVGYAFEALGTEAQ
ncbi:MAG: hypothetical protein HUJ27_02755 [Rhodobacteraceae bacterium]|nr:hypothetical protein [Paracoccaceae bacterium]